MSDKEIAEIIQVNFGKENYERALSIPENTIKILLLKENPLEIRCLIFEKELIYHLIIDEKRLKLFHNCPSILFKQTFTGNDVCLHFVKLFLLLDYRIIRDFLNNYHDYTKITSLSEILEEKLKNLCLLINKLPNLTNKNRFNHYLPKFFNTAEISHLRDILENLIEENYFLEYLSFLKRFNDKNIDEGFVDKNISIIKKALSHLIAAIKNYSFLRLMRTIHSCHKLMDTISSDLKLQLLEYINSEINLKNTFFNFNHQYLYYYFVKSYELEMDKDNSSCLKELNKSNFQNFIKELMDIINQQNYSSYNSEDISILKCHLNIFEITEDIYRPILSNVDKYVLEFERKFFLKKFAYLKLLLKRNRIQKQDFTFRRINDTFIVDHDIYNFKNDFYFNYLLPHLGFYGEKKNLVKARDIGENFYIFNKIFKIDWSNLTSISYFKKKMWDNHPKYQIKSNQGLALLRYGADYIKDGGMNRLKGQEVMIVEWDLTERALFGSIVVAYDNGILIPDSEHPLFYDIKPFDLFYCKINPKEIIGRFKIIEPISKCSFKDAIMSVSKGISFIEGFYPLSLVKKVLNKEIDYFKAIKMLEQTQKRKFVPHFYQFIYEFKEFLFNVVLKEDKYLFNKTKNHSLEKLTFLISYLKLDEFLSGIQISKDFLSTLLNIPNLTRDSFREEIINTIHLFINNILERKEIGSTIIFDLNKMNGTPFSMYSKEILDIRKEEFEHSIVKIYEEKNEFQYDISHLSRSYYGKKILEILNLRNDSILSKKLFDNFKEIAKGLGLSLDDVIIQGDGKSSE